MSKEKQQNDTTSNGSYQDDIGHLDIFESYKRSPYLSIKHSSYFQVYAELFEQYRNKAITFVEVGVLNGGSLFMWRDYFGPNVRIIGIDVNPLAKKWEKDGFEISIGSQSDPGFWKDFFKSVGPADIVLDDGGHRFDQQIITVYNCIPNINEGGLMIVEDTHTSYFPQFGYPSRYSFIEWTKEIANCINCRFPEVNVSNLPFKDSIYSLTIFESIVSFKINRSKCFESAETSNDGISSGAEDLRYKDSKVGEVIDFSMKLGKLLPSLRRSSFLRSIKNFFLSHYAAHSAKRSLKRAGISF